MKVKYDSIFFQYFLQRTCTTGVRAKKHKRAELYHHKNMYLHNNQKINNYDIFQQEFILL